MSEMIGPTTVGRFLRWATRLARDAGPTGIFTSLYFVDFSSEQAIRPKSGASFGAANGLARSAGCASAVPTALALHACLPDDRTRKACK